MEFEEEQGLFGHVVDGFHLWAYCRFSVYMKIEEILNRQNKRTAGEKPPTVRDALGMLANCTIRSPALRAPKAERLFFCHARKVPDNGAYKCIYTDDIAALHPEISVSSEFLYNNGHLKPGYLKNVQYLDYVDILPVLGRKAAEAANRKQLARIASLCKDITRRINEAFGVALEERYLSSMASKRYIWYKQKKKLLTGYIRRVAPKVIVETVGYETNKLIINEIGKELGITTVELQHGVIGKGHIAYNYLKKNEGPFLPDYLFVFSDYWKQTASYPIPEDRVIVAGYPYLESMMEKYPPRRGGSDRLELLVISQPEYSIKLLEDVKRMLAELKASGIGYHLSYKLHPAEFSMDNSAFAALEADGNVDVIKDTSVNLYSLFAKADLQVGVTSTAIYEGLAYSLPTLILHYEKTDAYMGQLCASGCARMCGDGTEAARLAELQQRGELRLQGAEKTVFFKPDALKTIDELLTGLARGRSGSKAAGI